MSSMTVRKTVSDMALSETLSTSKNSARAPVATRPGGAGTRRLNRDRKVVVVADDRESLVHPIEKRPLRCSLIRDLLERASAFDRALDRAGGFDASLLCECKWVLVWLDRLPALQLSRRDYVSSAVSLHVSQHNKAIPQLHSAYSSASLDVPPLALLRVRLYDTLCLPCKEVAQ